MPLFDRATNFHIYGGTFNDVQGNQATISSTNEISEEDERRKILAWVSPIDVTAKHFDVSNTRQAGTGQWLLNSETFQAWERGVGQAFWCPGMPGAGKTVLASLVIDHLRHLQRREPVGSIGLAWVYYNYKERSTQTSNTIQLSLIRQLASFSTELYARLKSAYQTDPTVRPTSAQRLFPDMHILTREFKKAFIVIDALDECAEDDREPVLETLANLQGFGANILITSRDHVQDIITDSKLVDVQIIDIYARADDITKYVNARLDNQRPLSKIIRAHPSLRTEIVKAVIESCDGMFLVATFHIEALRKKLNAREILDLLKVLPKTFPGIYDDAMNRIESKDDHREVALQVLSVLMYARRQLTVPELQHFIAVSPGDTDIDDKSITDRDVLLSICAGLVVIDNGTGVIRLVHFTAQQYFDTIRTINFPDGDLNMARKCITYLSFNNILNNDPWVSRYVLLSYCVHYWHMHVHDHQEVLRNSLYSLLTDDSLLKGYSRSKEIYHPRYFDGKTKLDRNYRHTGLHVAAATGLPLVAEWLMVGGVDANSLDFTERTPLIYACQEGDEKMADVLISKGAAIDTTCGKYGTALETALLHGHEGVVRLLLCRGATTQSIQDGTALHDASQRGHKAIVRLLLERGAAVNAQGGEYGSALVAASYRGHEAIVHLLLESDADVNAEGGQYGTALCVASGKGHKTIVHLLLQRGAAVDVQGGEYRSPLYAASEQGHDAVVHLLLERGADVNASGTYGTALYIASQKGYKTVVRQLCRRGADVNAQGRWGSALYVASIMGHELVVHLLLDNGADVNAQGGEYGNALVAASYRGHETIVRLLLENGAAVNAQGGNWGTALVAASYRGHEAIVRLLLDKGAADNTQGEKWGTALHGASSIGHEAIVHLLLECGADVNARGEKWGTALHSASSLGHEAIVHLLLKRGADVNARGGQDETALYVASEQGHEAVVHLLLGHRAAINAQAKNGQTALHAASAKGHETVARLLLENGAATNIRDGTRKTALLVSQSSSMLHLLLGSDTVADSSGGSKARKGKKRLG